MIHLFHLAHRAVGVVARVRRTPMVTVLLIAGLAGCRQKRPVFQIPQGAQAPVALEVLPDPDPPPMIATLPPPELAPLPDEPAPPPAPRKRPAPAPKEEPPPVQVAEAPAALAIGTLSTGGNPTPQSQHQAQDLITSILRRIATLSGKATEVERKQVRQIRHFLDQAQQALNSGDAEGAQNLATKARLLMDDLEKK